MLVAASAYKLSCEMPVLEPIPVPDTFVLGLHRIEAVGPCVRLVYFTVQSVPELRDQPCKIITTKVVMPQTSLPAGMDNALRFLGLSAMLVGAR